jgi:hypothetical protein
MWYYNVKIDATYAYYTSQWAWASISGVGWRQIKNASADGVTNMFFMLSAAKANDRVCHVYVDTSDNTITTAYMF